MRISDWSSDVCSSDLPAAGIGLAGEHVGDRQPARLAGIPGLDDRGGVLLRPGEVRSEERRVGKECDSTCRSRWSPYHYKKKYNKTNDVNKHQQHYVVYHTRSSKK